jgi:putative flippase GtrA
MARMTLLQRWTAFNLVGLIGIAVQLGALAALVHGFGWHYLAATAVAVEAAVLHNFMWHQRWTWKDRQPASVSESAFRLLRFHALNGAVSLVGNVVITGLLVRSLHIEPVAANAIAIVACALVNFAASDRLVFRSTAATALALVALTPSSASAGPGAAAASGWQRYEAHVEERFPSAGSGRAGGGFFAHERLGPAGWREEVIRGGVSMIKIDAPSLADAKIHHWVGAVFVPGLTLDRLLATLKAAAGSESRFYDDVVQSRLLARDGDRLSIFMKLRRTSIVTVTYNTEHQVEYTRLAPTRATARSVATRIAELEDAGTANEREKPAGEDSGFLWKLNAYWRYEEVAGGVIVECESVSLSRSVPLIVRPVANPIVDRIARESLARTLESLRKVLTLARPASPRPRP